MAFKAPNTLNRFRPEGALIKIRIITPQPTEKSSHNEVSRIHKENRSRPLRSPLSVSALAFLSYSLLAHLDRL